MNSLCYVIDEQGARSSAVVRASYRAEAFLAGLDDEAGIRGQQRQRRQRTVSQICSLICLPSMVTIRAPNSTPKGKGGLID